MKTFHMFGYSLALALLGGFSSHSIAGAVADGHAPAKKPIPSSHSQAGDKVPDDESVCQISKGSKSKVWTEEYSACVDSLIGESSALLSLSQSQVGLVCPRYSELDQIERRKFLNAYVKNWAILESNGNQAAQYKDKSLGDMFGLFMFRDADRQPCGVQGDLNEATVSLQCAVNFLEKMGTRPNHSLSTRFEDPSLEITQDHVPYFFDNIGAKKRFIVQLRSTVPKCFQNSSAK